MSFKTAFNAFLRVYLIFKYNINFSIIINAKLMIKNYLIFCLIFSY